MSQGVVNRKVYKRASLIPEKKEKKKIVENDSIRWISDISVGFDISRVGLKIFDSDINAFGAIVNMRIKNIYYGVFETGIYNVSFDQKKFDEDFIRSKYDYSLKGMYFKAGLDYDIFNSKDSVTTNIVYGGLRYGLSTYKQESLNSQTIKSYNLATKNIVPGNENCHWAEFVAGFKGEIAYNIYLGASVSFKYLLVKPSEDLKPYVIPGFGYYEDDKRTAWGINYYIYYRIPL